MTEYWGFGKSEPGQIAEHARQDEADGWDGLVFSDTQNLRPEVYTVMATAVAATERLKVAPGVTNPVTRHPAVAASAIAAIHAESAGRASWGVGRGDSALAYIGQAPSSLKVFETYVHQVHRYLNGEPIPIEEFDIPERSVDSLHLGDQPTHSVLRWLGSSLPPVAVEVVATGPKVIGIGGRRADYVTFTVGADLDRLRWGIETARAAAAEAGRDPNELKFGAYVNVACHEDQAIARKLVSGGLASFSRFSAMHGTGTGPIGPEALRVIESIRANYDMKHHGEPDSPQTAQMTPEFIDAYAVVGDPGTFGERIAGLIDLGIERIVMHGLNQATREKYPEQARTATQTLVREVLPHLPR